MTVTQEPAIVFYGTEWCGDCWRASQVFERMHVDYRYVDIDEDAEAAATVEAINRGYRSVPTIIFPDGDVLVEPLSTTLAQKLSALAG